MVRCMLLETGEPDVALKYTETAVKKRIPSGQLYLARNYNDLYRFEDAIKCYEEYISDLSKRKGLPQKLKNFWKRARPISAC